MPRAKTRVPSRNRRKKVLRATAGQRGKRRNSIAIAQESFWRGGNYAFAHRRAKKRDFRALWIMRINAAARLNGLTYGRFIDGLKKKGIELNRKVLAHLAVHEPATFTKLVEQVKA